MARTFAAAFAAVQGPRFDEIVGYTVPPREPVPTDSSIATALAGVNASVLLKVAKALARRRRCQQIDGDEALGDTLLKLWLEQRELFGQDPDRWLSELRKKADSRLRALLSGATSSASIEALHDEAGDSPFQAARPCIAEANAAHEDARHESAPKPGEPWARGQVIGAFQRFRDHHGRPPRAADCKAINGLPSLGVIYRLFSSFPEAVLAAGMTPDAPSASRKRWEPVEAALACRSFKRRNGRWPNSNDARHRSGELPGHAVMIRYFGGSSSGDVKRGVEAILAATEHSAS